MKTTAITPSIVRESNVLKEESHKIQDNLISLLEHYRIKIFPGFNLIEQKTNLNKYDINK